MEIYIKAQAKNGLLWRAVRACGSAKALGEYLGVSSGRIGEWLNFKSVPNFRSERSNLPREVYDEWDAKLLKLIGYGLEEIFPIELETNKMALREMARRERVIEAPIEMLVGAGAMPKQIGTGFVDELEMREAFDAVLGALTPREEKVINMRFGLGGYREHTLEEVGREFDVTRERIRWIEAKALRKLRHPKLANKIKGFYKT